MEQGAVTFWGWCPTKQLSDLMITFLVSYNLKFWGKWFLQLYQKLPSFAQKQQGILGINVEMILPRFIAFFSQQGGYPVQQWLWQWPH
jgi:hypothetical protein